MGDKKQEYTFPLRKTLRADWSKDFLNKETWQKFYAIATHEKANNNWEISQGILSRFFEKYQVPEIVRTTGVNINFDEAYELIAAKTKKEGLSLKEFKNECLKELIKLNLSIQSTYRSLKN